MPPGDGTGLLHRQQRAHYIGGVVQDHQFGLRPQRGLQVSRIEEPLW